MKTFAKKIVLLLSDPSITDRDFHDLQRWLRSGGIDICIDFASHLRHQLDVFEIEEARSIRAKGVKSDDTSEIAIQNITQLLLGEARMSKVRALSSLRDLIGPPIRARARDSFETIIRDLVEHYGASLVVSAAQRIRNDAVHSRPNTDWPLREK